MGHPLDRRRFPHWQAERPETIPEDQPLSRHDDHLTKEQSCEILETNADGDAFIVQLLPENLDLPCRIVPADELHAREEEANDLHRQANELVLRQRDFPD